MKKTTPVSDLNRRDFLRGSSLASVMALLGGVELRAQSADSAAAYDANKLIGPPVKCAVIGLGAQGRLILSDLARLPQAEVAAVCDTYPAFLRRGAKLAPKAEALEDYRRILDNQEIKAVVIATPTHKHRDLAVAALQAGKHVYCEAPLASTLEDARAIAQAAQAAPKQYFQAGLQMRSDPQRQFLLPFIRSGALGKWVMVRSQWHKKNVGRLASPNPEREKELNWRLYRATSPGLVSETGIHPIDMAAMFLDARPVAVSGFGAIRGEWPNDDRDVPDTVQAVFEYPGGVQMVFDCTMANSFDGEYEMYYGSSAAVMMRGNRAWLFKEVDSPLLGWEVYAKKERFGDETGIVLVANATKLSAQTEQPDQAPVNTPLYFALEAFLSNAAEVTTAVEDFSATFNTKDTAALKQYLADLKLQPHAGYQEGYAAAVMALKANEAILKGEKIKFQKEWFNLS